MSGVSRCISHALEIAKVPRAEWASALDKVPEHCQHQSVCTGGMGCRKRLADYLRVQFKAQVARERKQAKGTR